MNYWIGVKNVLTGLRARGRVTEWPVKACSGWQDDEPPVRYTIIILKYITFAANYTNICVHHQTIRYQSSRSVGQRRYISVMHRFYSFLAIVPIPRTASVFETS